MKTIISFLKFLLWSLLFSVLIIFIFSFLHEIFPETIQAYRDLSPKRKENVSNLNPWLFFLNACIVAPLVEECSFRLNLSKKIKDHYISISVASLFLVLTLVSSYYYNGFRFLSYSILILLLYQLTKANFPIKILLIISSIVFGLIHIDNMNHENILNPISYLVYTAPFMVLGYFFGLIRLKHGILFAILAHFLKNFVAFCLLFM